MSGRGKRESFVSYWRRTLACDPQIKPASVKVVGMVMSTYADADGSNVYPGDANIAKQVPCKTRTVRRARQRLVEHGYIVVVNHGTHRGDANVYRLTLPKSQVNRDQQPGSQKATQDTHDHELGSSMSTDSGHQRPPTSSMDPVHGPADGPF